MLYIPTSSCVLFAVHIISYYNIYLNIDLGCCAMASIACFSKYDRSKNNGPLLKNDFEGVGQIANMNGQFLQERN